MATRNPYTTTSSELFYGREALMRELIMQEQSGQSVVLLGGRRCGKSRTLNRLSRILQIIAKGADVQNSWESIIPDCSDEPPPPLYSSPHWPVIVNLEGRYFASHRDVLEEIAERIKKDAPPELDLPEDPENGWIEESFEHWLVRVVDTLEKSGYAGIALLFDEVEVVLSEAWCHAFLAFIRRLDGFTLGTRIWLVLVGTDKLDRYRHPGDGSPPLNLTRRNTINGLGYRSRRRMAMEPFTLADKLPPDDLVMRELDQLAGGNIWVLTHLLEKLYRVDKPDLPTLEAAAEDFLDEFSDTVLQRWSDPIDEAGWELYREIAQQGAVDAARCHTKKGRAARRLLEYHALIHRNPADQSEIGPTLFRRWAIEAGKIKDITGNRPDPIDENGVLPPGFYEYDVAISYTMAQHELANEVSDKLRQIGLRVFFDSDQSHTLWSANLNQFLPDTYNRKARVCLLLVSSTYVDRHWPQVEVRAAVSKALREGWGVLLPISLSKARLPEIPDSIVWLEIDSINTGTAEYIAFHLQARLKELVHVQN